MLFYKYISEYNIVLDASDYFELALWYANIALIVVVGIYFLRFGKKENKNAYYVALFWFLFAIGRICRLYAKFVVGYPYGFFEFTGILFWLAFWYTIITYIGLFFIYLFIEHTVTKKFPFFTVLVVIMIILSILNYRFPIFMVVLAPLYIIVLLGISILFFILAYKSSGTIRKNALIIAVGIVLFELGIAFDIPESASIWITIPGMYVFTKFASPILQIIGCILIQKGFPKEKPMEQIIKRYQPLRNIKGVPNVSLIENLQTGRRPEITEEQVSISKEKKVCIVCKGKILGFNYVCTKCETFYCENCALALTSLENECWACNEPIDKSKPIITLKKKELDLKLEISESNHKSQSK